MCFKYQEIRYYILCYRVSGYIKCKKNLELERDWESVGVWVLKDLKNFYQRFRFFEQMKKDKQRQGVR